MKVSIPYSVGLVFGGLANGPGSIEANKSQSPIRWGWYSESAVRDRRPTSPESQSPIRWGW